MIAETRAAPRDDPGPVHAGPLPAAADVVVIGAGSSASWRDGIWHGAACGWCCAKRAGWRASHPGGIRAWGRDPAELPLMVEAQRLWGSDVPAPVDAHAAWLCPDALRHARPFAQLLCGNWSQTRLGWPQPGFPDAGSTPRHWALDALDAPGAFDALRILNPAPDMAALAAVGCAPCLSGPRSARVPQGPGRNDRHAA